MGVTQIIIISISAGTIVAARAVWRLQWCCLTGEIIFEVIARRRGYTSGWICTGLWSLKC